MGVQASINGGSAFGFSYLGGYDGTNQVMHNIKYINLLHGTPLPLPPHSRCCSQMDRQPVTYSETILFVIEMSLPYRRYFIPMHPWDWLFVIKMSLQVITKQIFSLRCVSEAQHSHCRKTRSRQFMTTPIISSASSWNAHWCRGSELHV